MENLADAYAAAAKAVETADALLIAAGAGMGVDSGLPDFRGPEGFWKAYPPFKGRQFSELSTPHWFQTDPGLAWGFFGHRLNLYRHAVPHAGFQILRRWADRMRMGSFVFTSNVDGQFQKAGFSPETILECHGSIQHLQCAAQCSRNIWAAENVEIDVDMATIRTSSAFPTCPSCEQIARPNILMFGDWNWIPDRSEEQERRYRRWLKTASNASLVIIEIGAGLAVPSVRYETECQTGTLIRINPREPRTPPGGIPIPSGGLEALTQIDSLLEG